MFSRTTIESSTTRPIAMVSAPRVSMLSDRSRVQSTISARTTESGMETAVTRVERSEARKTRITMTAKSRPSAPSVVRPEIALETAGPWSETTVSSAPLPRRRGDPARGAPRPPGPVYAAVHGGRSVLHLAGGGPRAVTPPPRSPPAPRDEPRGRPGRGGPVGVQITRVYVPPDEPLDAPLGPVHAPGGLVARPRLDDGPVELVSPHPRSRARQHVGGERHGVPVPERQPLGHPRIGVEHPAHRQPVQRPCQIQQPGTLGGHRRPRERQL